MLSGTVDIGETRINLSQFFTLDFFVSSILAVSTVVSFPTMWIRSGGDEFSEVRGCPLGDTEANGGGRAAREFPEEHLQLAAGDALHTRTADSLWQHHASRVQVEDSAVGGDGRVLLLHALQRRRGSSFFRFLLIHAQKEFTFGGGFGLKED